MGIKITNKNSSLIGSYFFVRFQVSSRKYHEKEKPLFANVFRLKNQENYATIWFDISQDQIQAVIQGLFTFLYVFNCKGNSPHVFWSEIQSILKLTANSFQGINLDYSYMCPQCILKIEGKLKVFPAAISKDSVYLENISSMQNLCSSGHSLHPVWITQGYGQSPSDLKESFQGNFETESRLKSRCYSTIGKIQCGVKFTH